MKALAAIEAEVVMTPADITEQSAGRIEARQRAAVIVVPFAELMLVGLEPRIDLHQCRAVGAHRC